MKKFFFLPGLICFSIAIALLFPSNFFGEIVVIPTLKGYSHIYQDRAYFFCDVFLEVYGGNKYGGGIVLTPYSDGSLSNMSVIVEKIEFFVNVLDLFKVTYWFGNREYLGHVSSFQTRFYQMRKDFDLKGWHTIDGTGLSFDFTFFSGALGLNSYFYRSSRENEGIGTAGVKVTGTYRDVRVSIFSGISEVHLRGGIELRTFFRNLNFSVVLGTDQIPLTNIYIDGRNIYALAEEKFNFLSVDHSWGFEQIITFFMKPLYYRGIEKPRDVSDADLRLLISLSFLKNVYIGAEGIMSLHELHSPVTFVKFVSEIGGIIGFEENNILIKLQPMFLLLNTTENQLSPFRISILGELRF